jgi:hypothetical protein
MTSQVVDELRRSTEAVWSRLSGQLDRMDCNMERADGPGQWTTRQVLCHLLGAPGWRPVPVLASFADPGRSPLPVIEIKPGESHLTPERQMMKLQQFKNALARHRREVFDYLEVLSDEDLQRKARIPLLRRLVDTDEVTIPMWVAAIFVTHWSDHVDQLAKIRKAVGLPEAGELTAAS